MSYTQVKSICKYEHRFEIHFFLKKNLPNEFQCHSFDSLSQVVKNSSVSKTDKVKLFSEVVLRQIAELHQWQGPQAWSPSGDAKHKQVTFPGEIFKPAFYVNFFAVLKKNN